MLYISVRIFLAGVAALAAVAVGGSTVPETGRELQPSDKAVPRAEAVLPPLDPATLHGEIPNSASDRRMLTLGAGERIDIAVARTVREMDPSLPSSQVGAVVNTLLRDIQVEAPDVNLWNLAPGASMQISRKQASDGTMIWDAYLGKYSGIA